MKKVTIIGDFCYPNYMGGSSKHVYDLISNLPSDDIDWNLITRVSSKNNNYSADEIEAKKTYDTLKKASRIKEVKTIGIFNPLTYWNKIKKSDYIVLQHPVMGLFGAIIGRIMNKKIIYHYHGPLHTEYFMKSGKKGLHYKILWLMQKISVSLSNKVLTHAEYMKKISQTEHNVPNYKSVYLPPYIDRIFRNVPVPYLKIDDKIKILIPRRLTARTGVVEFLETFYKIPQHIRSKYQIYISGKGELQEKVETLVKKDPENIKYIGFISYDELWTLYSKVDAVVVPTLDLEGFGYIILEAMSCGTMPIVSKTSGGGYEFVQKHLGDNYTFDVYSPQSLVNALNIVFKNKDNRHKYEEIAAHYTTKNMINIYIKEILD